MSPSLERVAGPLARAVGVGGLLYGLLFVWIVQGAPDWVPEVWHALLVVGGLLTIPVTGLVMRDAPFQFSVGRSGPLAREWETVGRCVRALATRSRGRSGPGYPLTGPLGPWLPAHGAARA
ncbi:MAG: hypothetical protein LC799_25730, partial [Actinobacteria bacterium]|nr:hypothetical protein [Actinomycetota bacterium]